MGAMFDRAKKFDKYTIKGWELKGKNTYDMFGSQYDARYGEGTIMLEDL